MIILETSTPAAPDTTALTPVYERERILTIDVLRGIALLGVCVANVWLWFSGIAFRFPAYLDEVRQVSLDSAVFLGIAVLVSGKAISTFSFLFGLGFAVQMLRARARGRSVVPAYVRRLTVLLLIGVAHMALLWYGDILTLYAVFGFFLLLFRDRTDKTLLVWATCLLVAVPLLLGGVPWIMAATGVPLPAPDLAEIAERNAAALATFQSGVYRDIVGENLKQAASLYLGRKAPMLLFVFGLFLVGLYAGRRGVFEHLEEHRPVLRRIATWGIPIGLLANVATAYMQVTIEPAVMIARPELAFMVHALFVLGTVPLAAGYVAAATLLFELPAWRRPLSVFAPVGQMALTNYLMQTAIMLLVFYPYGANLIGRTGPASGLLIAVIVFAVQMVWSRVWLAYFRFGPMEWLWRSLTYGAMQPMRRAARSDAVPTAHPMPPARHT